MLLINANLSKYQLYKLKNQVKKVPTIIKQDDIDFFPILRVILLFAIYFSFIIMVGYQGVMLTNKDMLFWDLFVNISAIIRTRLWLSAKLLVDFYSSDFKKNEYEVSAFWCCYFGIQNSFTFKLCIKVSLAEIF